jgi:surfactin synthase thioesterase subunit
MSWLQRWSPRPGARLRLLCLPCAGGSAIAYRSWAAQLPAQVELVAVELPGHGVRSAEAPLTSMDDVVAGVLAELAGLTPRPLAVLGHSMGAVVGLELARAIRRQQGRPPVALLVSGSDSPATGRISGVPGTGPGTELTGLPAGFWRQALGELGGVDAELLTDRRLMDMVLTSLRGDLALLAAYEYRAEAPLGCAVRAYAGSADDTVTEAGLAAWRREGPTDFALGRLPGGHFFLRECAPLFLARLGNDLTRLRSTPVSTSNGATR